ncbi:MAG: SPOR domain-containing protein, partial [Gallionellaceae bacterium]|nr:SPOR domain-containing protein [Gallionellaceae bacterium]
MSRNARGSTQSKSGGSGGKGGSLFAGVLVGMVLGLIVAGGVAWYILKKNPESFEAKERREETKPVVESKALPPVAKMAPASAPVAAGTDDKQHFEFYKVLTDGASPKNRTAPKETKPAAPTLEIYYVQAGSFPNQNDAEKLKAKLALLGMEATLQPAAIPNKGTYYRVRLGPLKGADEMNKTLASLKQNGVVNATSIKA